LNSNKPRDLFHGVFSFYDSNTKFTRCQVLRKTMSTDTTTTTTTAPATKTRKPRDPNAEPLPLIIAVSSIEIPANLAEKARKRFSADLRTAKKKAYAIYEKECTDAGAVADKYEDWIQDNFKINLREFSKAFVAGLMKPVTDAVVKYAEEAQSMEFKTATRKTRISIDVYKLQTLVAEIISATMFAGTTNKLEMGIAQVVNRLPGMDLPENTDFSGVRASVIEGLTQYVSLVSFDALDVANKIMDAALPADNDSEDSVSSSDDDNDSDGDDTDTEEEKVPAPATDDEGWED
jgi:hypothetical protein